MYISAIDPSLSNTAISFIKIDKNYFIDLNNYINLFNNLLILLKTKNNTFIKINKKSINKNFDFFKEIECSNYLLKNKNIILGLYKQLLNKQNKIKIKYNFLYKEFNLINQQKEIQLKDIKYYLLTNKKKEIQRINEYYNLYKELLKEYKPKIVSIEGYSYNSKQQTRSLFELGELSGMFKHLNYINKINTLIIPPSILKKIITGKGNSDKLKIKEIFENNYKLKLKYKKNDDIYDSIGLLLILKYFPFLDIKQQLKLKII